MTAMGGEGGNPFATFGLVDRRGRLASGVFFGTECGPARRRGTAWQQGNEALSIGA